MPLLLTLFHLFLEELHFTGTSPKARNKLHKRESAKQKRIFRNAQHQRRSTHAQLFGPNHTYRGTHTRSRTDLCKTVTMGAHLGVHPCHWLAGPTFNRRACGSSPMLVHGAFHIYHAKPCIKARVELLRQHTPHKSLSSSTCIFLPFSSFSSWSKASLIWRARTSWRYWYDQYNVLHYDSYHVLHLVLVLILSI
jgi:hypothetical protein